jgi:hypothetical protein
MREIKMDCAATNTERNATTIRGGEHHSSLRLRESIAKILSTSTTFASVF